MSELATKRPVLREVTVPICPGIGMPAMRMVHTSMYRTVGVPMVQRGGD